MRNTRELCLVSARSVNFSFGVIIISSVKISVRQPVQCWGRSLLAGVKPRILDIAGYVKFCIATVGS